jgi:hypothetical protein
MKANSSNILILKAYLQLIIYRLLVEKWLCSTCGNSIIPFESVYWNSIPDGSAGVLPTDNYITIEMSEPIDHTTVNSNTVIVRDSQGNIVEGTVYLAEDGKTIIFIPKYGYESKETIGVKPSNFIKGLKERDRQE